MKRVSYLWLAAWLLFYAFVLPYAVPLCLDWLNRPSNWWLGCGVLGSSVLVAGVAFSLYQTWRVLTRYLQPPSSSDFNG